MRPLLALAAVLLLAGASSAATPGKTVTIQFRLHFTEQNTSDGRLTGTFNATGGIRATGLVAENYILTLPRLRDQQPVESVGGSSTLNTKTGVLTLVYTGVVSSASPTQTVTEGTWAISSGTGTFKGYHGRGRLSAIVDLSKRTMVKRYDGLVTVAHP